MSEEIERELLQACTALLAAKQAERERSVQIKYRHWKALEEAVAKATGRPLVNSPQPPPK